MHQPSSATPSPMSTRKNSVVAFLSAASFFFKAALSASSSDPFVAGQADQSR